MKNKDNNSIKKNKKSKYDSSNEFVLGKINSNKIEKAQDELSSALTEWFMIQTEESNSQNNSQNKIKETTK